MYNYYRKLSFKKGVYDYLKNIHIMCFMIDLHMHTTYSDGSFSLKEVLQKCEDKHLSVISITDHNVVGSYFEMENFNVKDYFSGHIVVGVELNTYAAGVPIELLGYNFDYNKLSKVLEDTYLKPEERNRIEFERLVQKCKDYGIKLDDDILNQFDPASFASKVILNNLMHYEENQSKINERSWGSIRDFYRDYMSNPDAPLFVDCLDLLPDMNTVINMVKDAGGLVFVPHIYEYRVNSPKVIEALLANSRIDGFECYYPTFSEEQNKEVRRIVKENNLFMSGGSDFHGAMKPDIEVGTGKNNLRIPESIQENWAKYLY